MKNPLTVFSNIFFSVLKKPGDIATAYVTKTGRKVAKLSIDDGQYKESITQYKNGTTVLTKSIKGPK